MNAAYREICARITAHAKAKAVMMLVFHSPDGVERKQGVEMIFAIADKEVEKDIIKQLREVADMLEKHGMGEPMKYQLEGGGQ